MVRPKTIHRCTDCGAVAPKWAGRCAGCGGWNTLVEQVEQPAVGPSVGPAASPVPIASVDLAQTRPRPTGVAEVDRVLGGGLVPGSVTLVGGEPGIGKSTLLTTVAAHRAAAGQRVLYVSAEESAHQVRIRAGRLGALSDEWWVLAETVLPHLLAALDTVQPDLVVVDSIQTVHDPALGSGPGTVVQVRECAHRLVREAKARGTTVVLVGHVTKDGALAGPRVLEHVVDTVLAFEGDRHHALRLLRAVKHRFGPTSELGVFEMTATGLVGVPDPSGLFLADRRPGVPGSVVVPTLEGQRPLLVEVQALVAASTLPQPRRSAQGVDGGRLSMLLAVLERRVALAVGQADVFVSAVGGVRLVEPGTDLALALAVASAVTGRPLPPGLVAVGEVGLGGEVRQVPHTARRLSEAARLGFSRALVPASATVDAAGIRIEPVATLAEALAVAGVTAGSLRSSGPVAVAARS